MVVEGGFESTLILYFLRMAKALVPRSSHAHRYLRTCSHVFVLSNLLLFSAVSQIMFCIILFLPLFHGLLKILRVFRGSHS